METNEVSVSLVIKSGDQIIVERRLDAFQDDGIAGSLRVASETAEKFAGSVIGWSEWHYHVISWMITAENRELAKTVELDLFPNGYMPEQERFDQYAVIMRDSGDQSEFEANAVILVAQHQGQEEGDPLDSLEDDGDPEASEDEAIEVAQN